METVKQKYVRFKKKQQPSWLLGESGSPSYLASQTMWGGDTGLELDLADGWIIKYLWEDRHHIIFVLEKKD